MARRNYTEQQVMSMALETLTGMAEGDNRCHSVIAFTSMLTGLSNEVVIQRLKKVAGVGDITRGG